MKKRILLALLALALAVSLPSCAFLQNLNASQSSQSGTKLADRVQTLLEGLSYYEYELDEEALAKAVVEAYIESTGDQYAYYYTAKEYEELTKESTGRNQGVGITVSENTEHKCIEIISVLPDSPALKAGVKAGDLVIAIGIGDSAERVSDIGYEMALKKLRGEQGTLCEFTVARGGDLDNVIEFSIIREEFISRSVMYAKSMADSTIGIVKILEFDLTTPTQFEAAMEDLISQGCTKFIYDVRNNPGGDLKSISAVLSFFYNEGDIIVRTQSRNMSEDEMDVRYCEPAKYTGSYESCSIYKENIGKYRDYPAAVIANGRTASAAELFASGLKDYGLATIVGETTYGKGCMQSIMNLGYYGLTGALKMTTAFYYPPLSDNYHGVGVEPDAEYGVELSEEAKKVNVYSLIEENQALDNQLALAIEAVKNK